MNRSCTIINIGDDSLYHFNNYGLLLKNTDKEDVELDYFYNSGNKMRTEIYYFSGTGNSLHVARELQKRLPNTKLVSVISALKKIIINLLEIFIYLMI